jgi:nicotinamidase-related amidase
LAQQRQELGWDEGGHALWRVVMDETTVEAERTAVVVCDMWDNHWSRGAAERVGLMAPRMNRVLQALRAAGVTIIHAPSDTLAFYADSPARQRVLALPPVTPPADLPHDDPPQPIDASDGGSDTGEVLAQLTWTRENPPWKRQHPAIEIDAARDLITDRGAEVYSALRAYGIEQVLLMGVHTNMCVLNRSFAIKQMVRWGVPIALVRDLTDAMYNPARAPYVSHAEGTALVIGYIEKFWCPTVESTALLRGLS